MTDISNKKFWWILILILALQLTASLWHINEPLVDGRLHYNWGPAFWLSAAHETNEAGLSQSYFGITKSYDAATKAHSYYNTHPELIGPVLALWTGAFGYSVVSIRLLAVLLVVAATLLFALAVRKYLGNIYALVFVLIFATLPLIYIYGKMISQEPLVLLFLALYWFAISRLPEKTRLGLILTFIAALGLALSDWSGLVFAFVFAVAAVFMKLQERKLIFQVVSVTLAGFVLGLGLFFTQSYLQEGTHGIGTFLSEYGQIYEYRSNTSAYSITVSDWLIRQKRFIGHNFTLLIAISGIAGLVLSFKKQKTGDETKRRTLLVTGLATLIGTLIYILVVRQASGVHIYYQYFLSVPVALGLLLLLHKIVESYAKFSSRKVWFFSLLILALTYTTANAAYEYLHIFNYDTLGDATDIALISKVKDLPPGNSVIGSGDQVVVDWLAGPNIRYYAGRPIDGYLLEKVPFADYQFIPKVFYDQMTAAIASGQAYGRGIQIEKLDCSENFCLIHLLKTATKKIR